MKRFSTEEMASGGLALVLEPAASWEKFQFYAKHWVKKLNAKHQSKPVITVDESILEVTIFNGNFWITYDDCQSAILLEPKEPEYNKIILALQRALLKAP